MYERAKGIEALKPFGTELDVYEPGYGFIGHSLATRPHVEDPARNLRVDVGGPDCSKPYSASLINISAMSFGALSANHPEPWVVGYSPSGPRDDPGPTDLSGIGINTLSLSDNDVVIALDSNAPQLGSSWNLALSDYGPFPFGFLLFGDTKYNPGISLAGLGAPGCSAYTNGNLSALLVPLAGGAATVPIPIPNNPSLSGAKLACQATAPSGINTFGIATSNGLDVTVGL